MKKEKITVKKTYGYYKIRKVGEWSIGDLFEYDRNVFKITSFPTRSMVCGDLNTILDAPAPQSVKVPIRLIIG